MARTAAEITDADRRDYIATARRRAEADRLETERRRAIGWAAARRAAEMLRGRFGATRVAVYGSLARGEGFTRWSDVDLFAEGIPSAEWLRAIGDVYDSEKAIDVNLALFQDFKPRIREAALTDAVDV